MGQKRALKMSVRVVTPGTLKANPKNPFSKEPSETRREGMIQTLVAGLAVVFRKQTEACVNASVTTDLTAA